MLVGSSPEDAARFELSIPFLEFRFSWSVGCGKLVETIAFNSISGIPQAEDDEV